MAIIDETDTPIPAFASRNVFASWKESSWTDASATIRLTSGVARTSPSSPHPSLPSTARATPAFGA